MDGLEKFIVENKEKFNDHIPSPEVWENVERELHKEQSKKFSIRKFMTAVVAAIALVLVGVWLSGASYSQFIIYGL